MSEPMAWHDESWEIRVEDGEIVEARGLLPASLADLHLEGATVKRTLCLELSDDLSMPLQCRFRLGHLDGHDWEIEKNPLTDYRTAELRDTPSGVLPVRVPGAALGDAEGSEVPGLAGEADRPLASAFPSVIERWRA